MNSQTVELFLSRPQTGAPSANLVLCFDSAPKPDKRCSPAAPLTFPHFVPGRGSQTWGRSRPAGSGHWEAASTWPHPLSPPQAHSKPCNTQHLREIHTINICVGPWKQEEYPHFVTVTMVRHSPVYVIRLVLDPFTSSLIEVAVQEILYSKNQNQQKNDESSHINNHTTLTTCWVTILSLSNLDFLDVLGRAKHGLKLLWDCLFGVEKK